MKYHKVSKSQQKEEKTQMVRNALHGEGIYLYRNPNSADISLPKPTNSGVKHVGPGQEFQGDNYYMQLVRSGLLRLVKEIQSPEQQRAAQEVTMNEEKLILDQPDTITESGKVEQVVAQPVKKIEEAQSDEPQQPVLLNEGPVEGGFVIV